MVRAVDMMDCIMGQDANMTTLHQGHVKTSSGDLDNSSMPQVNTSLLIAGPVRSMAVPIFSMTLGALSNIIALFILLKSYARFRRRSKATFLLFASSLVLTDFAGHIIPGALVLQFYSGKVESDNHICQLLGGSLIFFGLCPLFLGCIMAVERCVGITRPLLHSAVVTSTRTKLVIASLWVLAGIVAILPFLGFGRYKLQYSKTWCFIAVGSQNNWTDSGFAFLFSFLGVSTLVVSLICNTISGVSLIQARIKKRNYSRRTKSHDIEMVVQLVGIMMASCICWSPMLVYVTITRIHNCEDYAKLSLLGVRMASWNQILDPWVYILLRRAVLKKIYQTVLRRNGMNRTMFDRWEVSSFQSSDRSVVKKF
ncbi:prostaglandin E2 receptor EP1 subtype-like [Hypanus sabinus]|uniref:prostaglandin E2 receptor EP1 subtype-like n=1 Tax=Hypanus sabinus TaxID=79690 RepID=UPI0028C3A495|nr:prostaglandin E2 receptor EP1 subtype-like [Hypanus sabinus]XP_059848345.1 prostaglandin E2 receptor EP1 subtype-like [Hypanus sabinus]XP_059848346.1 prostaglandin E2 receptor EP1 subtype-like [Hypanus sabinus]XP_059848348.1 prostaglandin E2 receptor EP1 subtype-like [Hypanus sabinus]XP_059848349.1 prostaglandin E2 receptor EP1 subtype-like [Hypanus sabinus]XP_059848350.1 prostaglandin E2 receptor EP1 subtype-like [Hypanus sabinus]